MMNKHEIFKIYKHITLNINTYFKVNAYICTLTSVHTYTYLGQNNFLIIHIHVKITNIGNKFGNFKSEASVIVGIKGRILAMIRGHKGTQR